MSRQLPHESAPARAGRHTHATPDEDRHDPYREAGKLQEPTVCPDCRAVFENGRWGWRGAFPDAAAHRCPACRRISEHLPAGVVGLSGPFLCSHRDEVMACVRRICDRAYLEHPLERLMEIDEDDTEIRISTTSAHLARSIGRALEKAWDGELDLDASAHGMPRVAWRR